jgi:hypothetical protein
VAIATLGISSEEFFDLAPVEFYFALKHKSELEQAKSRELYETVRLGALLIINHTPGVKGYQDPLNLIKFGWEEKALPKQQSVDEMKGVIMAIARTNKAEFKTRK